MAEKPEALEPLVAWLESQFAECPRIVVKDPRLAWFFELHRAAAARVGADVRVATMLRHPAEVMRSREIAYGTRTNNTTRVDRLADDDARHRATHPRPAPRHRPLRRPPRRLEDRR